MFLYHGQDDPMISEKLAKLTYEVFTERGFNFTYTSEAGLVHSLSLEEINLLKVFFDKHMVWN